MILAEYYKTTTEFKKGQVPKYRLMGQKIQAAMDAGQTQCFLLRFVRNDFLPQGSIQTPRGGLFSNVSQDNPELDESLHPVVQWLHREGLEYRVSIPIVSNVFTPVYHRFADLVVYWEPRLDVSPDQRLLDYWTRQVTCKCLDASFEGVGNKRVKNAMDCGQRFAVLMTIYAGSDYTFQVSEFEDKNIVHGKDLQPVKGLIDLDEHKFQHVVQWVNENKLKYLMIVSDPEKPSWAYLCVIWEIVM